MTTCALPWSGRESGRQIRNPLSLLESGQGIDIIHRREFSLLDFIPKISEIILPGRFTIMNPSHEMADRYPKELIPISAESPMRNFNERMTVNQMIDLVAFLQSACQIVIPDYPTALEGVQGHVRPI